MTAAATGRIIVVGLGPAGPELLSPASLELLRGDRPTFLRTRRHHAAGAVGRHAADFDDVYESEATMEGVYAVIVRRLRDEAAAAGEIVYAVPGSPMVAERTVQLLLDGAKDSGVEVDVVPAMSFLDLAWARLGVDPLASGVRLIDGHRFATEAAGERGPLLVAQCDSSEALSEIKLAFDGDGAPPTSVTVLRHLGLPDERVWQVPWAEIDHAGVGADHLTSLYIPELAVPVGTELVRFAELVRTLREQCPWDREQTHHSLRRHALEEAYEVVEAIDHLDPDDPATVTHLEEELGDLLFQVYFHATLGAEQGWFTLADVARGIHDKLVRRHPHVFADAEADTADTVLTNWEEIKKAEKGRASVMDGIASSLPALMLAAKVGKKAAGLGFDWPDAEGAYQKLEEEIAELRCATGGDDVVDELGDVLFCVVNIARHLDQDPEAALRAAVDKFRRRFRAVEVLAEAQGLDLSAMDLPALDRLWDQAKAEL